MIGTRDRELTGFVCGSLRVGLKAQSYFTCVYKFTFHTLSCRFYVKRSKRSSDY